MNGLSNILLRAAGSWKTTAVAVLIAVVAIANALIAMWDGDPATMPDWNVAVTALIAAVGLFLAKDGDKDDSPVFVGKEVER